MDGFCNLLFLPSSHKISVGVNLLLFTYISRNANAEAGNSLEGLKNDEITPNTTTSSKNDVQMLMSQVHDLSFMLKSELSIPSKTDNLDP